MNRFKPEWLLLSIMMLLVAVVFWQVLTDMTQAGIASGGPFDNAAAYPRGLAILLALLVVIRSIVKIRNTDKQKVMEGKIFAFTAIIRPVLLLVIFSVFLMGLKYLGYHIMTTPFIIAVLYLCGERRWVFMLLLGIVSSLTVAFAFEVLLNVVLPGGIFHFNIPW
jgi:putative tricarboxylic transport membrane protein